MILLVCSILVTIVISGCDGTPSPCENRSIDAFCNEYIQCPTLFDLQRTCTDHGHTCTTEEGQCVVLTDETTHRIYYFRPDQELDTGTQERCRTLMAVDDIDPDAPHACKTGPNVRYGDMEGCTRIDCNSLWQDAPNPW